MPAKDIYIQLQELLDLHPMGAPLKPEFLEILRELFSEEEARLATFMKFTLQTSGEIAKQCKTEGKEVYHMLENMANKGVIYCSKRSGESRYALLPPMPGIFEFTLTKGERNEKTDKLGKLWDRYFMNGLGQVMHNTAVPLSRVLPVGKALPDQVDVLSYERASEIIRNAWNIGLASCQCRFSSQNCQAPLDVCLILNSWADFLNDRKLTRPISKDEALAALDRAEEAGLVHCTNNTKGQVPFICNCCSCCCNMLRGVTRLNFPRSLATSSYLARVEEKDCLCDSLCTSRCHFNAIKMGKYPEIDEDRCVGCGLCVSSCPTGCLKLVKRDDFPEPPAEGQILIKMIAEAKGKWEGFRSKL